MDEYTGGAVSSFNSAADNGYGKQFAGANFSLGKEFTIGAVLSYDPSFANFMVAQMTTFVNALRPGGAQVGLRPVDVFELTGTYDLGSLTLGAGVLYGRAKNDTKNATAPVPRQALPQSSPRACWVSGSGQSWIWGTARDSMSAEHSAWTRRRTTWTAPMPPVRHQTWETTRHRRRRSRSRPG